MYALSIQQLVKTYGDGHQALKGIDLTVLQGDFFALLGANGAGKSTTIGIISSLVNKSAGNVSIFGHDLFTDTKLAKACIGLVPQEFNCNIFENPEQILINQAGFYGISRQTATIRAKHYLSKLGLWEKRAVQSRHLSGGMKRRLMIARSLMHEPKMLILDEPTAGVDIEIRHSMWAFLTELNQQGTTIILTTHYLEEAEHLCRNIAIIDKGKIIENSSMKALLQRNNKQGFILDLINPINEAPAIDKFFCEKIDDFQLEIHVDKSLSLNQVFSILTKHNITCHSLRTKSNRLETLFLDLINHD